MDHPIIVDVEIHLSLSQLKEQLAKMSLFWNILCRLKVCENLIDTILNRKMYNSPIFVFWKQKDMLHSRIFSWIYNLCLLHVYIPSNEFALFIHYNDMETMYIIIFLYLTILETQLLVKGRTTTGEEPNDSDPSRTQTKLNPSPSHGLLVNC